MRCDKQISFEDWTCECMEASPLHPRTGLTNLVATNRPRSADDFTLSMGGMRRIGVLLIGTDIFFWHWHILTIDINSMVY